MKRLSMLLTLIMIMALFSSCGSNNNEGKIDEIIQEENVVTITQAPEIKAPVTEKPVVTEQPAITEQPVVTEDPEELEIGGCEATVIENEDGTLTVDYVITDSNGKVTHRFSEKPNFDKEWYEMFTDNGVNLYKFVDYNFDGYLDIRTQQYGAFVNQYYNIRIWNNSIGEFELNQDYMDLPNLVVNAEKEQIFTTNFDRGLGNFALYEVKEGQLTQVATINVTIKDNGSFEYIEVIGNGEETVIDSVEDLDEIWEGYKVFIE